MQLDRRYSCGDDILLWHCSLEMWSFELIVLLSGLLPNPKLETSVLSIR